MEQLTKLAIIEETVEYYSKNPEERRAITEEGGYAYMNTTGNMCAVGRCLVDACSFSLEFNDYFSTVANKVNDVVKLQNYFKEEYQGHDYKFWSDLQTIHDLDSNWDYKGLTKLGEERVERIKRKYAE